MPPRTLSCNRVTASSCPEMKVSDRIRMRSRLTRLMGFGFSLLITMPIWCQTENELQREPVLGSAGVIKNTTPDSNINDTSHLGDRMLTPPLVGGQFYPTVPTSTERSNYLRYGVLFTTAYTDNVLGGFSGRPIGDATYSIAPTAALDVTTSRMHWQADYAPGFTFYQRISARKDADHSATIDFQYRLSPHATLSAGDNFLRSSSVFHQYDLGSIDPVSGGTQVTNASVIVPIADRLRNSANVGLTDQFALNEMIGASGTFTNLHYPNPAQVSGLYDSSSQSASAFFSRRVAQVHYVGITYQYQRLVAQPTQSVSETQTQAAMLFYTFFPSTRFSLSFFGGSQYSHTVQPTLSPSQAQLPETKTWTPAAGASLNWQGRLTAVALSYSHMITPGSGLVGAVYQDSGTLSLKRQIRRTLNGSLSWGYAQNNYVGNAVLANNGHSIFGTASLEHQFVEHMNVQIGYTRIHQTYSGVPVLSLNPDTNRAFVSISYQFSRPLGR